MNNKCRKRDFTKVSAIKVSHCKPMVPYRHEADIQGRGKTVHVIFEYHPNSILQLICGYFIQRRRNLYSPLRCFLHAYKLRAGGFIVESTSDFECSLFIHTYMNATHGQ
jgi:hypothetical protein